MRIVILPTADLSYNSGSVIYIKKLFQFLLQKGYEVYMFAKSMPTDISYKYKDNIVIIDSMLFHPIIDDRVVDKIQYYNMITDILVEIKKIYLNYGKIDLIHAQYASVNGFIAAIAKNILNIPMCLSVFGRDINIGYNIDRLNRYMIFESIKNATSIIVANEELRKKISEIYKDTEQYIIPMPVDREVVINNRRCNFCQKHDVINSAVITSCFTPEKGIEIVLLAMKYLMVRHNFHLYIAGQDDAEDLENYKRISNFIEKAEMGNNVTFLGYLSRKKVGQLIHSVDFVIDARLVGNFSSVILEALFCGCMIFASNTNEHVSLLDKNMEFLFKNGNPFSLAKKIEKYISDEEYQIRCMNKIKKWREKNCSYYNENNCFDKICKVYEMCVKIEK